jgi:pilus assembly protein FimV
MTDYERGFASVCLKNGLTMRQAGYLCKVAGLFDMPSGYDRWVSDANAAADQAWAAAMAGMTPAEQERMKELRSTEDAGNVGTAIGRRLSALGSVFGRQSSIESRRRDAEAQARRVAAQVKRESSQNAAAALANRQHAADVAKVNANPGTAPATGTPGTPGAAGTPGTPGAAGTPGTPGAAGTPGVSTPVSRGGTSGYTIRPDGSIGPSNASF